MAEGEDPAPPTGPQAPRGGRRADFFAALGGTFLFGWAAAWLGGERELEWLHYVGLTLVLLPLVVLMIWLGRLDH